MTDPRPNETSTQDTTIDGGTWSSLKHRIFAVILLTQLFTQMALFMNGLGGAWVLTDITDSPSVVASLQIAVALPAFLLALLAGALADIVSRKRIILLSLAGSAIVSGAFALLSAANSHSTASVLGLTTALGILSALAAPAWIAIMPGLVPRSDLAGAMTLSSAGMSAAMAVGPALGGLIIAAAGPTWVFVLNVVAFAAGIVAFRVWKPAPRTGLPAEHLASAIRIGLQYVRYDRPLQVVIGKLIPFALTGTALMSLLPAVARFRLEAGPAMFGLLSGAGGIGAVVALLAMPRIRRRVGPDTIVLGSMLINAGLLIVLAMTTNLALAFVDLVIVGAANLALISTMMIVLQVVLPAWIRGRGVAVYLLAFQGAFAIGALLWGSIAEQTSLQTALIAAGVVMAISALLLTALRLGQYMDIKTDMVHLTDNLSAVTSVHDDDGPILLTAQWQIDPDRCEEFVAAMEPMRRAMKQKGALSWHLVENVEQPGHLLESFTMATWSEYKRLAERSTIADKDILDAVVNIADSDLPPLQAHRVIKVSARRNRPLG